MYKKIVKMFLKMWMLIILILATGAVESDQDEIHKNTLVKLANDFRNLPVRKQYGVMYMHPPGFDFGTVLYSTDVPYLNDKKGNVTIPHLTKENRNNFQFSYVATTPDYKGAMYSSMMNSPKGKTLHTEDLMLNLVYNGMKNWYKTKFCKEVEHVYLFTYYLPCPDCSELIKKFVNANPNVRLYVGFSQRLGENNPAVVSQNENRRKDLMNFLNDKKGKLFDVNSKCNRRKRSTDEVCSFNGKVSKVSLYIDFRTGKAMVSYKYLPESTHGWIGLYDKNHIRIEHQFLRNSTGTITFNSFMNELYYAQYWQDDRNMYLNTGQWKQCGFGWTILNKLPCQYGTLRMRVQIKDGCPYVCLLHSGNWIQNSNDWLMAQQLVNFASNTKQNNWQPTSSFISAGTNMLCKKFPQMDTSYDEGFRVKYVYNNGTDQYEGPYDNSSPVWIPDECSVTSSRRYEVHKSDPTSGAKQTEANMLIVFILFFSVFLHSTLHRKMM